MRLRHRLTIGIIACSTALLWWGWKQRGFMGTPPEDRPDGEDSSVVWKADETQSHLPLDSLEIVVTYDNNTYAEGLGADWGFSCVVRGTEKTILFDTGADGALLLDNMDRLGIDPDEIDLVMLSHIHGDHTGGLRFFLRKNPEVTVYCPKSFGAGFRDDVERIGARVVEIDRPQRICAHVYSTGEMGGWTLREQGLVLCTDRGLVVITGCAHPGIVEMVQEAKSHYGQEVLLAMGGFHLVRASQGQQQMVAAGLRKEGVAYVGPAHCTGDPARELFRKEYADHYLRMGVGRRITAEDFR